MAPSTSTPLRSLLGAPFLAGLKDADIQRSNQGSLVA
jgi:hypothetical protein